jgi:putative peptidoglycan lipid II flippase
LTGRRRALEWAARNGLLLRAAFTAGSVTLVARSLGAGKELMIAHHFGASEGLDAFLLAFAILSFIINSFATSFGYAFLPAFVDADEKGGPQAASQILQGVVGYSMLACGAAGILAAMAAPFYLPLLGSSFPAWKLALTRNMLYAIMPAVLLAGFSAPLPAALNARRRYAEAAAASAFTPAITVVLLLVFGRSQGIRVLAAGTVVGAVAEAVFLALAVRRLGLSIWPRLVAPGPALRRTLVDWAPLLASAVLGTGTSITDQGMAAALGSGAVSRFNYGTRVSGLLLSVGALAISNALLPHFSRQVAQQDWSGVRDSFLSWTRMVLIAAGTATAILVALSLPIVRLLFQRGAFTAVDTGVVAAVQQMFLLQVPFNLAGAVTARVLIALRRNRFLGFQSVVLLGLNAAFNLLLMPVLGVAGVALSTSAIVAMSFLAMQFVVRRELAARC